MAQPLRPTSAHARPPWSTRIIRYHRRSCIDPYRTLGRLPDAIYTMIYQAGGVRPRPRVRSPGRLALSEREEISRGLAAGESARAIPRRLGRAGSTVTREIAANGGVASYRAVWPRTRPRGIAPVGPKPASWPGKDDLVAIYLHERDRRWRANWEAAIEAAGDDRERRLLAVFDALEGWWRVEGYARGCAHVDAAVEITDPAHPARQAVTSHKQHLHSRLAALADEAGDLDPNELARELLVIYEGTLTSLLLHGDQTAITRAQRVARQLIASN